MCVDYTENTCIYIHKTACRKYAPVVVYMYTCISQSQIPSRLPAHNCNAYIHMCVCGDNTIV